MAYPQSTISDQLWPIIVWPTIVMAYIVMAYPQSTISSTAHDLVAAGAPKLFSEAKAASDSMTIKNAATTSYN